jgi:16S rRNA processing protein RimM
VVRLREVTGVDEAESLRGAQLAVTADERPELPEGQFYVDDLTGLSVATTTGEDLGKVEEVLEYPANAVCVVRGAGRETLVPVLKSVIREVDLATRRMVVELPEEIDADTADGSPDGEEETH